MAEGARIRFFLRVKVKTAALLSARTTIRNLRRRGLVGMEDREAPLVCLIPTSLEEGEMPPSQLLHECWFEEVDAATPSLSVQQAAAPHDELDKTFRLDYHGFD